LVEENFGALVTLIGVGFSIAFTPLDLGVWVPRLEPYDLGLWLLEVDPRIQASLQALP
jgi:hypothetical protein